MAADQDGRRPWHDLRLANGLRLIVSPDHSTPIAAVNLWYRVGSRDEQPGQHGFAHLFEHLMFEGSAHVRSGEHFAALTAVGATNINATTDFERTNYYETVPIENLPLALWLEADRMGSLELTDERLENQRAVVANERRQRYDNQPYGDWVERMLALTFPDDHPYRHPVIGSAADLEAARLDQFADFHRTYYAPNNAVLSIVGDVTPDHALELVDRYFGGLPAQPAAPRPAEQPLAPAFDGPARSAVTGDVPMARFWAAYRTPPAGTSEYDALSVLVSVLGAGRGCRLFRALVRDRQLAQPNGGFFGIWDLSGCPSLLVGSATARSGISLGELEDAFHDVVARTLADGIHEDELARARAQLTTHWLSRLSTVAGSADTLSAFTTKFDDPGRIDDHLSRLLRISADEIVDVARTVIDPGARRVLTFEPAAAEGRAA